MDMIENMGPEGSFSQPNTNKIQPLSGYVAVKIIEKTKSEGGIYIPPTASEQNRGIIIAVGPGRQLDNGTIAKPRVNVGDKVIFKENAGLEVILNESSKDKFKLIDERSLLAVIK